ncbi:MAG TPA: S41 family peptidase [Rectinemataceae bacterium]|nr:S41 family peptidase [Rectinemataceae bacterium]
MSILRDRPRRSAIAWSLVCVIALSVCFFAVSAPEAVAQATTKKSSDDAKRYSQLIQTIYQFIIQNYVDDIDPAKLYEGAMKGMFDAVGDPHSTFLDEAMLSDLMRETDGEYAGVGLYISKIPGTSPEGKTNYVEVVSPIEDTPGWKEGVLPGDLIMKIDGESTADMTVDQASAKIRGPAGTKVLLSFMRGTTYAFDIEFVRATIEIPAIKTGIIRKGGAVIGYLRIIEWIPQTADRMQEALIQMTKEGMTHLIVDVRSNPGGLLSSVVSVSDLFLDSGMIVSTKGRSSQENYEYKADASTTIPRAIKMMVLVNKGSASASEIFSGAMKDQRRALLLGEKTYGKGSVQQIFPLDTTGFKLTMARYYTPSGVNIDKSGIEPDIVAPDWSFSESQFKDLEKLYDEGLVQAFAKANPDASPELRKAKAKELVASGFSLPQDYIDRLLRDEIERAKPSRVYDLEFDTQLNKAIEVLLGPDFNSLLENSKSVSQALSAK